MTQSKAERAFDCVFAPAPIAQCGADPNIIFASVWPLLVVAVLLGLVAITILIETFTRKIDWDKTANPETTEERKPLF